jgi:outer membrane protein TolC
MDRIRGFTVILATLLLFGFEPWPCRAQHSALPATSIPPPRPGSDFGVTERRHAPLAPTGLRSQVLVSPALEDLLQAAAREPTDRRLAISLGVAFQDGSQSTATPDRESMPPPRRSVLPSESTAARPAGALDPAQPVGDLFWAIRPVPLEPTDLGFPINLATALRLSDARPLIVAAAQASVWVAEAQLTRAKVLWVPTLNLGGDYIRHDGGGPDFNKGVMTSPSVNFFYAGGGLDVGTLTAFVNLTDAYFEPLVARRVLDSRQWDIQRAKNDALLLTADAYFRVHQYRGVYAGALYCVERARELVAQIASLGDELVSRVEVERARNLLAELEQRSATARQAWRVHSANLTQTLRLNPSAVVVPLERDHLQLTLIDPAQPLPDLQKIALTNRPELASQRALVQAAEERIRREKMRPFLPIVLINGFQASGGMLIQAGLFGLGANSSLNQWAGRDDVSLQLVWQLEAFGIGNLARIKDQRGEQSQAIVRLYKTQDMVAAEVTAAQARLQSAAARVTQADRALRSGMIAYNGNVEGLHHTTRYGDVLVLVYRPQEVVYALRLLKVAFDEYFTTVADYNRAEFELFHALGYPAQEITYLRPPGNLEPVDTARPAYLPPVGNGPPPATR